MPHSNVGVDVTSHAFICACDKRFRSACDESGLYQGVGDLSYCVFHSFSSDKAPEFREALRRRLDRGGAELLDFSGVWFPEDVSFSNRHFTHKRVLFTGATFNGAADFSDAKFEGRAYFTDATFEAGANFQMTTFKERVYFSGARFHKAAGAAGGGRANFMGAVFNAHAKFISAVFEGDSDFAGALFRDETLFSYATFRGRTNFALASITGALTFSSEGQKNCGFGPNASLSFKHAKVEKSDTISFHVIRLRPHWFVDVDARKISFAHVDWQPLSISKELRELTSEATDRPHQKLAAAYRHLATNAEENYQYERASVFRRRAMDVLRREDWRGFAPWRLSWWYWLASGYGERASQAAVVLLAIWVFFAALYTQTGFARPESRAAGEAVATNGGGEVIEPVPPRSALTYSAAVMTLQKPEPRPATEAAKALVLLQTVLGPLQGALLALAIRRKFMR